MLVLKILLVPFFLAGISLAARKWGANVAGWLAGFPVVAGPILFFLAFEHGDNFAATASAASLSAVFASVGFNVAYSHACVRFNFLLSLVLALLVWFSAAFILTLLPRSPYVAVAVAGAALLLGSRAFPQVPSSDHGVTLPAHELLIRMIVGAALTICVTALADLVGPRFSGLLAVFPVLGSVLAVFSQRAYGAAFAVTLLRGMVMGLYSFTAFCFVLSLSLSFLSTAISFLAAVMAALFVQWIVVLRYRYRTGPEKTHETIAT